MRLPEENAPSPPHQCRCAQASRFLVLFVDFFLSHGHWTHSVPWQGLPQCGDICTGKLWGLFSMPSWFLRSPEGNTGRTGTVITLHCCRDLHRVCVCLEMGQDGYESILMTWIPVLLLNTLVWVLSMLLSWEGHLATFPVTKGKLHLCRFLQYLQHHQAVGTLQPVWGDGSLLWGFPSASHPANLVPYLFTVNTKSRSLPGYSWAQGEMVFKGLVLPLPNASR